MTYYISLQDFYDNLDLYHKNLKNLKELYRFIRFERIL